jgi:hypothetical protein
MLVIEATRYRLVTGVAKNEALYNLIVSIR